MQRVSKTRSIGGYDVTTTQFPGPRALQLAPRVAQIMTPLLHLKGKLRKDVDASELVDAVGGLFMQLDEKTVEWLCQELLVATTIVMPGDDGKMCVIELRTPAMRDLAFGGEDGLGLLVQVLLFVAEVNFARYFFALARLIKKTTPGSESTSPKTSDPSTPPSA